MTATRDLIAAALTLADIDEHVAEMPTTAAEDVREMCARAISETQPVSEVPMPEPTTAQHRFRHPQKLMPGWSGWQPCEVQERPTWKIDSVGYEVEYRVLFSPDQMRKYGDAREAAGVAVGGKDAERYRWLRDGNDRKESAAMRIALHCYGMEWDAAIDAALRGEVKP